MSLALLMMIVFLTPVAFTACAVKSFWCTLAYGLTTSGGPAGFGILLVITGFFYAWSQPTGRQRILTFLKATVSLSLFFLLLAILNERYTKHFLKLERPSHRFMLNQTGMGSKLDSLYMLDKEARGLYFEKLIRENPERFSEIDNTIRLHWIEEAGFSFPSGHSFNAFLFAMIIAYAIWYTRSKPQWRRLYFLPFAWAVLVAVSRVAVGAHTALDVSAGAGLGVVVGALFLRINITRYWLTGKKINK